VHRAESAQHRASRRTRRSLGGRYVSQLPRAFSRKGSAYVSRFLRNGGTRLILMRESIGNRGNGSKCGTCESSVGLESGGHFRSGWSFPLRTALDWPPGPLSFDPRMRRSDAFKQYDRANRSYGDQTHAALAPMPSARAPRPWRWTPSLWRAAAKQSEDRQQVHDHYVELGSAKSTCAGFSAKVWRRPVKNRGLNMLCLEVAVNGERYCLAGADDVWVVCADVASRWSSQRLFGSGFD